jgi:hypothetical protein
MERGVTAGGREVCGGGRGYGCCVSSCERAVQLSIVLYECIFLEHVPGAMSLSLLPKISIHPNLPPLVPHRSHHFILHFLLSFIIYFQCLSLLTLRFSTI